MKIYIFVVPLLLLSLTGPIWAVEPGVIANRDKIQVMRDTRQASRSAEKQARCEAIADKINFRLTQSERNRDRHYTAFQNIRKHIDAFINRATTRNCDVSTLKNRLGEFDIVVEKFSASFRDWKTSAQAARELRCDPTATKTTGAIQTSAAKFDAVRIASDAVRSFAQDILKPEFIKAVQSCRPAPSPELKGNE